MENQPLLPPGTPSPQAQSWGALISIIIIMAMVIIGAFYAWGKRIAETQVPSSNTSSTTAQ